MLTMDPKFLQYLQDNEVTVRYLVDNIHIIRQLIDNTSKQQEQTSPRKCHKCREPAYEDVECRDCFWHFDVCETHYESAYNCESPSKSKGHYCNRCD